MIVQPYGILCKQSDAKLFFKPTLIHNLMADRRPDIGDQYRAKRQKTSTTAEMDPKANPYLAHMYEENPNENGYSNGYGGGKSRTNGTSQGVTLAKFPRHSTTAKMARTAEDGPNNPFSGQPLSKQYFDILKTRRDLPVHAQRCEVISLF